MKLDCRWLNLNSANNRYLGQRSDHMTSDTVGKKKGFDRSLISDFFLLLSHPHPPPPPLPLVLTFTKVRRIRFGGRRRRRRRRRRKEVGGRREEGGRRRKEEVGGRHSLGAESTRLYAGFRVHKSINSFAIATDLEYLAGVLLLLKQANGG